MKRSFLLLLSLSLLFPAVELRAADSVVREAQEKLHALGRYSGEVDGVSTAEFRAALRYFQQDNGLEATGDLSAPTRDALRNASVKPEGQTLVSVTPSASAASADPATAPLQPTIAPPSPVPPAESLAAGDRAFLENHRGTEAEETEEEPSQREDTPAHTEPLLAGGPYEEAAPEEQAEVLRRAESILRRQGLLDDEDGLSPASPEGQLEEALFRYQSAEGIPLTGRLDTPTLAAMRLMPGRNQPTPLWTDGPERPSIEVFRGRPPRTRNEPFPDAVRGIPLN